MGQGQNQIGGRAGISPVITRAPHASWALSTHRQSVERIMRVDTRPDAAAEPTVPQSMLCDLHGSQPIPLPINNLSSVSKLSLHTTMQLNTATR